MGTIVANVHDVLGPVLSDQPTITTTVGTEHPAHQSNRPADRGAVMREAAVGQLLLHGDGITKNVDIAAHGGS